ncbi:unnamed protein product [Bathycoccus prasinos]
MSTTTTIPLLLLDDDSDEDSRFSHHHLKSSSSSQSSLLVSSSAAAASRRNSFSASPPGSPHFTNHMRHATNQKPRATTTTAAATTKTVRRVKDPVNMAPPRRVPVEIIREDDDATKEEEDVFFEEDNASEFSSCSNNTNATTTTTTMNAKKPPNPWKVDVHSEANRISFDFARARDGVLEKALQRKVEIESNVVEKVRKLGEFKRNARFAARTLRVWREKTKEANEPGRRIRESMVLRKAFCTFRKNAKIARALKERRSSESSYAFAQFASMRGGGGLGGGSTPNNEIDRDAEALRRQLEIANKKLAETDARSNQMEQTMRQAFMRGVCALNLEAMKLMRTEDSRDENEDDDRCGTHERSVSPQTVVRRAYEKAAKMTHNVYDNDDLN